MNNTEIWEWITEKDPTSLEAQRRHLDETDEEQSIRNFLDYFWYTKLEWCGCGNPDAACQAVYKYLRCCEEASKNYKNTKNIFYENFNCESIYDNDLLLCLAYAMDSAGFTEHGSGIGGAWLTREGGNVFVCIRQEGKIWN